MLKATFLFFIFSTLAVASPSDFEERAKQCNEALSSKKFELSDLGLAAMKIQPGMMNDDEIYQILDRAEFNQANLSSPHIYAVLARTITSNKVSDRTLAQALRVVWKLTWVEEKDTYPQGYDQKSVGVVENHLNDEILSIDKAVWLIETALMNPNHGASTLFYAAYLLKDQSQFRLKAPAILSMVLSDPKVDDHALQGVAGAVEAISPVNGDQILESLLTNPNQRFSSFYGSLPNAADAVGEMARVDGKWAEGYFERVLQKDYLNYEYTRQHQENFQAGRGNSGRTVESCFKSALKLFQRGVFTADQLINIMTKAASHPMSDQLNTFRFLALDLPRTKLPLAKTIAVLEALAAAANIELESIGLTMDVILDAKTAHESWDQNLKSRIANTLETLVARGQALKVKGQPLKMRCNCQNTHDNRNGDDLHWVQKVEAAKRLVLDLRS